MRSLEATVLLGSEGLPVSFWEPAWFRHRCSIMTALEALGCQSCGLPITPCLVCASPVPVSQADDALIKTCRSCGVVNPLGDKYREVLDIPPASALPSGMVRRAQIARVGRRPYVLAKHAHFMHLSSVVSERKGEDGQDGGSESQGLGIQEIFARLGPKGSPVPEVFASAEEGHPLTFLPYMQDTGARMHQEAVRSGRKAMDTRRFYPYSDSESPVKRMRLSPRQEVDEGEKNSGVRLCPTLHQSSAPACIASFVAAVSNGRTSSMYTLLKHDATNLGEATGKLAAGWRLPAEQPVQSTGCHSSPVTTECRNNPRPTTGDLDDGEPAEDGKTAVPLDGPFETLHDVIEHGVGVPDQHATSRLVEELGAHEAEETDHPVRDVTGSEEVPTRRQGRVCSECGQASGGSGRSSSNGDEAELMRCCNQILELHCPHTLKADMVTLCAYPLCCPVPRFPLPPGNPTSSSKVCRSYVTQFTVDALRAAHSTLTSSTQESTSEEVVSPLRGVEQALAMAERFIEIKDRMGHVQGLVQQVDAASAQASRDFKAYGDHGAFSLASQLIPRLLRREKQQSLDRVKNDVQAMTAFLQDINKLLTTCFQYVGKILEAPLCSVGDNVRADLNAMNLNVFMLDVDTKPGLEAVRTAVPLWLRLYHDVAHASGLLK